MLIVAASVGLTPMQFWGRADDISTGMTLREFDLYVQGFGRAAERERELIAWHAACVMNCWTKKKITVDALLGRNRSVDPLTITDGARKGAVSSVVSSLNASAQKAKQLAEAEDREIDLSFVDDEQSSWVRRLTGPDTIDDEG